MKLEVRLNKCLQRLRGDSAGISREAAVAWVRRAGNEKLIAELGLADPGQIKDLNSIISAYTSLRDLLGAEVPNRKLMQECYRLKSKKAESSDCTELARELQNSVVNLPGDVFYLSGIETQEDYGIFAMLRHINQCSVDDVAMSPDDLRFGPACAKRIARLNPPYLFALTQSLAQYFPISDCQRLTRSGEKQIPFRYAEFIYSEQT